MDGFYESGYMITISKIDSSQLDSDLLEYSPIKCLDCHHSGQIPVQYFLVKPTIDSESEHLELEELIKKRYDITSFSEVTCDLGHVICLCRCPKCGSEEILYDF